MERILAVAFVPSEKVVDVDPLEVIAAALHLKEQVGQATLEVGLVGAQLADIAGQLGGCGVSRCFGVSGEDFSDSRYASDALALEAIIRAVDPTLVVAIGGSRISRVLPGVAVRVGGRIDTHVADWKTVDRLLTVERWFYRQRMRGRLSRSHRPWFIVADPGIYRPWSGEHSPVNLEILPVDLPANCQRTRTLGVREPAVSEQTIRPDAELLFVAGAGWTKRQADGEVHLERAEDLILSFLKQTRASLGGSKSMVDMASEGQRALSFLTHLNQIGQTGATPRHQKGLATCCHGEEPHVVGWRFVNERRAINTDPNCGWAQGKADVLYVEDAFAVLAKINELLSKE